jgi:hypothetical protein
MQKGAVNDQDKSGFEKLSKRPKQPTWLSWLWASSREEKRRIKELACSDRW